MGEVCKRCKEEIDVAVEETIAASEPQRKEYPITCADCGKETTVPFEPNPEWAPPKCKDCFQKGKA